MVFDATEVLHLDNITKQYEIKRYEKMKNTILELEAYIARERIKYEEMKILVDELSQKNDYLLGVLSEKYTLKK